MSYTHTYSSILLRKIDTEYHAISILKEAKNKMVNEFETNKKKLPARLHERVENNDKTIKGSTHIRQVGAKYNDVCMYICTWNLMP